MPESPGRVDFSTAYPEFAARRTVSFVAAAGLVAHYVGDACQPLHGSSLADGYPDERGKGGVHAAYESQMIDEHGDELIAALPAAITSAPRPEPPSTGKAAAALIIGLMDRTAKAIDPVTLTDAYIAASATPKGRAASVPDALWEQSGAATIGVIADGVVCLAAVRTGAWTAGRGDLIATGALTAVKKSALQAPYGRADFVPSLYLSQVGASLAGL